MYMMSMTPAEMTKNQNVLLQPRYCVNMPPNTGANAGANIILACTAVMKPPRSAAVVKSATTAEPIATVAELPVLCMARKTMRAA